MATFTIKAPDGRKIKIKAADEATAIRGAKEWAAANPAGAEAAMKAASAASQKLKGGPGPKRRDVGNDLLGATAATIGGIVNGIPVAGPLAQSATDAIAATGSMLTGGDFGETYGVLQDRRKEIAKAYPVADISGRIAGSIGSLGLASTIPAAAEALGVTGVNLASRIGNSALSSGGLSIADSMARGEDAATQLAEGGIGTVIGGAVPALGSTIKAITRPLVKPITEAARGLRNPAGEAAQMVTTAVERDKANIAAPVISAADEATARMNGQPILNVDRGGETTRALMRSAANQNPEARAVVEKLSEDRFRTQTTRATDFFRRVMGGNVDDLARKAQIKSQSQPANKAAYDKAYAAPQARAVWTPEIRQLMQSDSFRSAIKAAESRGTDVAAAKGFKAVRNPFEFRADGTVTLKANPDGSRALPSLQYWDQVKRELDSKIGIAKRAGDDTTVGDLTAIKSALVRNLDAAVPAYKEARGTAAAFFDAEDAVEAGRKAFATPKALDESLAAIRSMSKEEKDDFAIGMVSQLMDDVRAANNRTNLTRMFDIEARKELMEAALGPGKARQFEAFVRVEDIMDKVRGSLGNSTTARQLVELGLAREIGNTGGAGGLGGVAGFAASGGNLNTAMTVAILTAAGRAGLRSIQGKANAKVLQQVAELLASGNKADLDKAISSAMLSKAHMEALEAIQKGIGISVRGAAQALALN